MFEELTIVQRYNAEASRQTHRAVRFAAGIACKLGARSVVAGAVPELPGFGFYDLDDEIISQEKLNESLAEWPANQAPAILINAGMPGDSAALKEHAVSAISVELEPWHTEGTLFAASGLAHLLGDPKREPLVPSANYGAHTIGYAAFAALTGIWASLTRFQRKEYAVVNGEGALSWVNWKAAVAGELGQTLTRQGEQAEWPVIPCKDGHVAFVYTERDWDVIVKLIDAPELGDERFATFGGRAKHRDECMAPIRAWCATRTKAELSAAFEAAALPCAPALTVQDLLSDPLLTHRNTFQTFSDGRRLPELPHRIEAEAKGDPISETSTGLLPLSGLRVLDLGIITAGAGVSALLADMGAEVIKVESKTYPDPFRSWAGASDEESPLFKSNNRNKKGLAVDLKTEQGKRDFLDLVKTADIVIENFRRGVLDRLGLTFERLKEENPNILLASISGQGLTGPGSQTTTFGSTLEASSAFASLTCYDDGVPVISGRNLNYPDQIICLYGAAIIAAYAIAGRREGKARHIDVSQRDCAIYQIGDVIGFVAKGGMSDAKSVAAALEIEHSNFVKCKGSDYVAVRYFGSVNGGPDAKSEAAVAEWLAGRTLQECGEPMPTSSIIIAPSRRGVQLTTSQKESGLDTFLRSPNGARVKGFPFQFTSNPMTIWGDSPNVGEHTDQILDAKRGPENVD